MIADVMRQRFKNEIEMVEQTFIDGTKRLIPHWKYAHPPVRNVPAFVLWLFISNMIQSC